MEIYFIVTFVGEHCSWRRTILQTDACPLYRDVCPFYRSVCSLYSGVCRYVYVSVHYAQFSVRYVQMPVPHIEVSVRNTDMSVRYIEVSVRVCSNQSRTTTRFFYIQRFLSVKFWCLLVIEVSVFLSRSSTVNPLLLIQAMHFNRDDINLPGFHKFFLESAEEEMKHAQKVILTYFFYFFELLP